MNIDNLSKDELYFVHKYIVVGLWDQYSDSFTITSEVTQKLKEVEKKMKSEDQYFYLAEPLSFTTLGTEYRYVIIRNPILGSIRYYFHLVPRTRFPDALRQFMATEVFGLPDHLVRRFYPHEIIFLGNSTRADYYGNCPELRVLVAEIYRRIPKKFEEVFNNKKITEKAQKRVLLRQKAQEARTAQRVEQLTIPGSQRVMKEGVIFAMQKVLQDAGFPFSIGSPTVEHGKLFIQVDPIKNNYATQALIGRLNKHTIDRTGERLYAGIKDLGFDPKEFTRSLMRSKNKDCKQFGVLYGENAVLGAFDTDPFVRKAAEHKRKLKKKKEEEVRAAKAAELQKIKEMRTKYESD